MVRTKDGDGIKSGLIVAEVQKRPCLYDTNHMNYGDRSEKMRSWEEVYEGVVPGWLTLGPTEKSAAGKRRAEIQVSLENPWDMCNLPIRIGAACGLSSNPSLKKRREEAYAQQWDSDRQLLVCTRLGRYKGKEVQKRWRSIRDSYTKAFRQGKCPPPEMCAPGSKRYQYHRQMSFLLRALQNKKPRYSQDKYESFSEISNSPQHPPPDDIPRIKQEVFDRPLDLKTKPETTERPETQDKCNQATIDTEKKLEIKIDANTILPDDHFDDDKLFMTSLLPLFKKMDDDTRLLCRIEVLKIIRYALQGHKGFEALKIAEDSFFKNRMTGILAKEEIVDSTINLAKVNDSKLSMTTRSADGSRPIRKRRPRSPSPLPMPPKRRGPGRPRKIRPPPSDSEEEQTAKKRFPRLKVSPVEVSLATDEDSFNRATSVAQLSTPLFMKMYNLERSKIAPVTSSPQNMQISIKTEPLDVSPEQDLSPI